MNRVHLISDYQPSLALFDEAAVLDKKVKQQLDLIKQCIQSGESLATALRAARMSYDNLVYTNNHRPTFSNNRYFTLEDFTKRFNDIPVVSLFAGAGGLDLGLEAAGFAHSLLVEKNPRFCETITFNRPQWDVYAGDVSNTEEMIEIISNRSGSRQKFDGLFVGGPPVSLSRWLQINGLVRTVGILSVLGLRIRPMVVCFLNI